MVDSIVMFMTVGSLKVLPYLSKTRTPKMKFAGTPKFRSAMSAVVFANKVTSWMFGSVFLKTIEEISELISPRIQRSSTREVAAPKFV